MEKIYTIITELSNITGNKAKSQYIQDVYKKYDINTLKLLTKIFKIQFDTRISTNIASKSIKKIYNKEASIKLTTLNEYLDFLPKCTGADTDLVSVQEFINNQNEIYKPLLINISIQNLKIGMTAKTINKALNKELIYNWEIQGGNGISNLKLKDNEVFALQQKLNGIRASYYKGKLLSRQGIEHNGFSTIIKEIENIFGTNYFIDGELIRNNIDNCTDNENFRKTTSIVNAKDYTIEKEDILFIIYDIIPVNEFDNNKFTMKYITDRMNFIQSFQNKMSKHLRVLKIDYIGSDKNMINKLLSKYDELGLEGLMLYKDVVYKKAKHNGLIKIKSFRFSDLEIVDWFLGDDDGRFKDKFGGFIVKYKGNTVRVGSGYTDEQREYFLQTAKDYIGSIAEIKYKEESKDTKTGLYSLQFPVFQRIRNDKDEESYE